MTNQNPQLLRVQDIPKDYTATYSQLNIDEFRKRYSIKQQFNYLFFKVVNDKVVSVYGSYGHSDVSEIYHVMGELIV
jgi:hypothetical protein